MSAEFIVSTCCYCLNVGWIGNTIRGEWKGHPTTQCYCLECCDRLQLERQISPGPMTTRVENAIAELMETGTRFTRKDVCDKLGVYSWTNFCVTYPELKEYVEASVNQGFRLAVERALEFLVSAREPFKLVDVCREAGIAHPNTLHRRPDLYEKVKAASEESKHKHRKDKGVRRLSPIDYQYRKLQSPEPPKPGHTPEQLTQALWDALNTLVHSGGVFTKSDVLNLAEASDSALKTRPEIREAITQAIAKINNRNAA